jgi:hypothetical protein
MAFVPMKRGAAQDLQYQEILTPAAPFKINFNIFNFFKKVKILV